MNFCSKEVPEPVSGSPGGTTSAEIKKIKKTDPNQEVRGGIVFPPTVCITVGSFLIVLVSNCPIDSYSLYYLLIFLQTKRKGFWEGREPLPRLQGSSGGVQPPPTDPDGTNSP